MRLPLKREANSVAMHATSTLVIPFFTLRPGGPSPAQAFKEALLGGVVAKEDKKDKGEEYEFSIPDFDEDGFIHKEMVSFRTTTILFVVGIVAALISWGIYELMGGAKAAWFIGLAVMAAAAYGLRFIYPLLKVDIRHFGRREWFGTFFLIFFAWLAFFILFVNPPISDHADPTADVFLSPSVQVEGGDIDLDLFVADNFRVDSYSLTVVGGGSTILDNDDLTVDPEDPGHFEATLTNLPRGSYVYLAEATDGKGRTNATTGSFLVGDIVSADVPQTLAGTSTILVTVDGIDPCDDVQRFDGGDCLRTVYLDLADGTDIHLEFDATFGGWKATANFDGWTAGTNQFDVVVEQMNQFYGHHLVPGGTITLTGYSVEVPSGGGSYSVTPAPQVTDAPVTRQTPGFGLVAGIVVLVGAVWLKRRQE